MPDTHTPGDSPVPLDPRALAALRPQLMKFALRRLRDAAAAEDAVQETFLAALEGGERFGGRAAVATWLTGILKHKILDHFRRGGREGPLDTAEREGDRAAGDSGAAPVSSDPEDALSRVRAFTALESCVSRLPPRAARALHMRAVLGMSAREIGRELGTTASSSSVLLHRARASLRECMRSG